jgi:hypothetical protein
MDATERLGEEIGELSARLDAATQRLLACIRQFDQANGWERQGAISCAHWLAWRIGLDTATARERVRVARALGALAHIDEAFGRGELSYAKVRAMTRVATPATEDRLLEMARNATGAQLERICRGVRQVRTAEALYEGGGPPPEDRSVRERLQPGGMVRLELVLGPDEAALVMKAVEKMRDQLREEAHRPDASAETSAPATADASAETSAASACGPPPSRADGVVALATLFLSDSRSASTGAGAGGDRYQLIVHLHQDVLGADGAWAATLDDGNRVSAETLRRLACDGALVPTCSGHDDAGVLNVGRRTRSIPSAIRRALWVRDRGCRFPGCPHTRFLHGHHIQHWLHGGPTSLGNLVLLCPRHHRLVHEGGFTVDVAADGVLRFRSPETMPLPLVPPRPTDEDALAALEAWAAERDVRTTPDTNRPQWDGDTPDYDWAVSSLLN